MEEKKKVLIVDDEPDTVTYFSNLYEDNGYVTVSASNGDEALKLLSDLIPDLITLDVSMPEMSGVKFYRTLKESEKFKEIPVIFITGVSKDFEKFISTRSQVPPPDGYISKPIDTARLLELSEQLISA